ncbi:MAG: GDSL-type esterase/lipase family protein [Rariglobus sp.]
MNTATVPAANVQRDNYDWEARRAEKQAAAAAGNHDLVFIGDSITHRFEREDGGLAVWQRHYGHRRALNLGYGWDCTQNVLWRIENGEFSGQRPKLVVLNIGTNNLSGNSACRANTTAEIVAGISAICYLVERASPETCILVMSIFPRGRADEMIHARVKDLNAALTGWLATRPRYLHLDIGAQFFGGDGEIDTALLPDRCHPVEPGYVIWAEALEPLIQRHVDGVQAGESVACVTT